MPTLMQPDYPCIDQDGEAKATPYKEKQEFTQCLPLYFRAAQFVPTGR